MNFDLSGVVYSDTLGYEGWYYVVHGKVQKGSETVAANNLGWWYIGTDGKVDFNKNTVAPNSNGWWVIRNGKVDFSYNGIASNANGDWYCQNGKVNFNANDVLYTPQGWYYFRGGKVQKGQETVQCNSSGWWYIGKDGKVDFNYNGIASNTMVTGIARMVRLTSMQWCIVYPTGLVLYQWWTGSKGKRNNSVQ